MTAAELIKEILADEDCFPWATEVETGEFIAALARMHGCSTVLELGTWRGLTTLMLAEAIKPYGGGVYTVDKEDHTKGRLRKYDGGHRVVHLIQDSSVAVLARFDMVFFDSSHDIDTVRAELDTHWKRINPGGLLVFHDVSSYSGPSEAAREAMRRNAMQGILLRTQPNPRSGAVNGIMIARKP